MKNLKTILFSIWVLFVSINLAWCTNKTEIDNNQWNGTEVEVNGWSNYEWELVIQWVGPEISMETTVDKWTLVLRWSFEDHTDHVFLKAWKREDKFDSKSGYLPWNTVKFKWYVEPLDAAAWNHYYDVINIENLEVVSYPDSTWVKELLEWWNFCETDNDCTYIMWECPFGCFVPLYKKFADIAWNVMENYFDINGKQCVYSCVYMDKAVCNNYKCEMTVVEN